MFPPGRTRLATKLAKALLEGSEAMWGSRVRMRARRQKAYAGYLPGLLRLGGERRGKENRTSAGQEPTTANH
jgi:hypothetical protein